MPCHQKTFGSLALLVLFTFAHAANCELVRASYEGTRPIGMGGAFLALADDHNMLWYNPAGLAYVDKVHSNVIDITLGVDSVDTLNRFVGMVFDQNIDNAIRTDQQFNRFYAKPTFIAPYFGFSIYNQLNSYLEFANLSSLDVNVDLFAANDIGAIVGGAVPLTSFLSVGASLRAFTRSGVDGTITLETLLNQIDMATLDLNNPIDFTSSIYTQLQKMLGTGWAIGATVGALAKFKLGKNPTDPEIGAAFTIEDVTNTEFRTLLTDTKPSTIPMVYNLGVSAKYPLGPKESLNFAIDYRDILGHFGLPFFKQLYMGGEYRTRFWGFRAGLYQLNPTVGLSIEFPPHTRIHLATYAPSLGGAPWEKYQIWFVAQAVIGFNPF